MKFNSFAFLLLATSAFALDSAVATEATGSDGRKLWLNWGYKTPAPTRRPTKAPVKPIYVSTPPPTKPIYQTTPPPTYKPTKPPTKPPTPPPTQPIYVPPPTPKPTAPIYVPPPTRKPTYPPTPPPTYPPTPKPTYPPTPKPTYPPTPPPTSQPTPQHVCSITAKITGCVVDNTVVACTDLLTMVPADECGAVTLAVTYSVTNAAGAVPVTVTSVVGASGTDVSGDLDPNPLAGGATGTVVDLFTVDACGGLAKTINLVVQASDVGPPVGGACRDTASLTINTNPYTPAPTPSPSALPSAPPTPSPSASPSAPPTPSPSASPSAPPTPSPSASPSATPSAPPTPSPSASPSAPPTPSPSASPSATPSAPPTPSPSASPSAPPTPSPSASPSSTPSAPPTPSPTYAPTAQHVCTINAAITGCTLGGAFAGTNTACNDLVGVVPAADCGAVTLVFAYSVENTGPLAVQVSSVVGASGANIAATLSSNPVPSGATATTSDSTVVNACNGLAGLTVSVTVTAADTGLPVGGACHDDATFTVNTYAYTPAPTKSPTYPPTPKPTPYPTKYPTYPPTPKPTPYPTKYPTKYPTPPPTIPIYVPPPTPKPTTPIYVVTPSPTKKPTKKPTKFPTKKPVNIYWP